MAAKLTVQSGSSPSTPSAGFVTLFSKTDKKLWFIDDSGAEFELSTGTSITTTDDLPEGTLNLYFTNERAQDAVGGILLDTATIDLTYNDGLNLISADVKDDSITNAKINSSAAISYSKLNLAGSIVNNDINASAAIAYSKLNLSGGIVNTDVNAAAAIAYSKLSLTGSITNADLAGSIAYSKLVLSNSIVNTDINASAAIAYSKLNLTGSIVNADVDGGAAIAYSKLNLAGSIVNADVNAAAAISYSKLNLAGSIVNADVSASAAIALSKLASLTTNRAVVTDGSGVLSTSSVTSTELGYVAGATSTLQTQIDGKQPLDSDLTAIAGLTTNGLIIRTGTGTATTRTLQGNTQIGVSNGSGVAADPVISINAGSITNNEISASAAIAYSKLSLTGSITNADLAGSIAYSKLVLSNSIVNADINTSAAIAYSKLNLAGSIVNADINAAAAIAYSKLNLAGSIVNADISTSAAIARSKIATGTANQIVVNDSTGALSSRANARDPVRTAEWVDDFTGATNAGDLNWNVTNAGTGATTTANIAPDQANNVGVWQMTTGSTATGRTSEITGTNQQYFGVGAWTWEMYVKIPTASNGTDRFKVYAGFGDTTAAGDMTDGVYFSYTDTESSGNWQLNTANNSTRTATDSTVATGTWQLLRIDVNAAGTSAVFKINGTTVGTLTTNIPTTAGRESGFIFKIEKSVGTTARTFLVDFFHAYFTPTTART